MGTEKEIELLDFRPITRDTDKVVSHINLRERGRAWGTWIKCGTLCMRPPNNHEDIVWRVGARFDDGVTDREEDSAWVFNIEVIGLTHTYTENGLSFYSGVIGVDLEMFNVPDGDYRPENIEGAYKCDRCDEPHWMLPKYIPAPNKPLWRRFIGCRIDIITGPKAGE